jgi:hypothetical protein
MDQQPISILFSAVFTLGALTAIAIATILLDIVLCGGNCLVPPSDIAEAQQAIIDLTDYDEDVKRL